LVTDIGAHDVFSVNSATDVELNRPMPLQVPSDRLAVSGSMPGAGTW
jgi:hypothetical protein